MLSLSGSCNFVRRALVLTAVFGASVVGMSAQSSTPAATKPALDLSFVSENPTYSSSASTTAEDQSAVASVTSDPLHLNAMQYNGRPRYQRPRYRGENTNADGSNKWMFYGGAGFAQPSGNTWKYFTPNWGLEVGGGRQYSAHFAVPIEFDYDSFGLTKQTLDNQFTLYNNQINYFCSLPANYSTCIANGVSDYSSLDGNAHIWSFSVDPRYTIRSGEGFGAYGLVGVGFYHKVTNFETPEEEEGFDPYYGYEDYVANSIVDHYTSNAVGFSAGFGLTYKISHFSGEHFYAEARYVFIDNSHRAGINVNSPVNSTTIAVANDFAPNSNRTGYFPVKFGIQF